MWCTLNNLCSWLFKSVHHIFQAILYSQKKILQSFLYNFIYDLVGWRNVACNTIMRLVIFSPDILHFLQLLIFSFQFHQTSHHRTMVQFPGFCHTPPQSKTFHFQFVHRQTVNNYSPSKHCLLFLFLNHWTRFAEISLQ